jgi:group II intron reverse transcriptase/maturase
MAKGNRLLDDHSREVREMRNAETVLAVIRDRGKRGLPLEDVYRQLYNPDLYLRAYGRIYSNDGALTRGVTKETVDGMSLDKINAPIAELRDERFRWTPARRVEIPKQSGKTRPLGIPTWRDKLLQEVMRSLLDAYYEPQFSDYSHGFRPDRGCHTALTHIAKTWTGTKWFIEGDIKGCFDNIDHDALLSILREHIHDGRFLRLVERLLKAGYLAEWCYYPTLSGTPQGGVVSPILANIYLDRLDKFVEEALIPDRTRGTRRKANPPYQAMRWRMRKSSGQGRMGEAVALRKQLRRLPSTDPDDPDYRRLRYIRYADDFLLGFIGPKDEAEEIKGQIADFLSEHFRLELSAEKTLITHATTRAARFLGYEIASQHSDTKTHLVKKAGKRPIHKRAINGAVSLRLPADVVEGRCALYQRNGKPIHRPELLADSDFTIVATYQSEYRGYVQYYAPAQNISWLNRLRWVMETSLLKTLAGKHRTTVKRMARKYRSTVQTNHGPRRCLEVKVERDGKEPLIARFGGIPLRRQKPAVLQDHILLRRRPDGVELLQRLQADKCELCGSTEKVEVHHIRKLANLKTKRGGQGLATWAQIMAARQRKTLVVCSQCHDDIHAGRPVQHQAISL